MRRHATLAVVLVLAVRITPVAEPQVLVHPRAMGLRGGDFAAPDAVSLRHGLPGGGTAYVVQDDLVPLVRFTALIGAGRSDSAGAAAYAAALRSGPAAMAPGKFAEALARMAAQYQVEQAQTETRMSLEVPREDAVAGMGLFAALLRTAPAGEVSSEDQATGVEQSDPVLYEGSLDATVRLFEAALFADHPYGGQYSDESSASATAFHHHFVVPANVVLAVSGDFDPAAMRVALTAAFDDWGGEPPSLPVHPMPDLATERRLITYPVDKLQGWVVIGHELPDVPVEDEAALMVMNYVLGGGHFDTRLFRATRDRRGLTNDDSGFPEQGFRGPGVYTFRTYGRPEVVRLLIQLTFQEIERIRAEPVSEEDLFVARGALADGDFSLWFRNGAATATTYAREWLRYGSHTRTASWQERVRAVTAGDVLDAARQYLHPERMQVVVVGPIDAIRSAPALEAEPSLEDSSRGAAGGRMSGVPRCEMESSDYSRGLLKGGRRRAGGPVA
jgi:zinc protease